MHRLDKAGYAVKKASEDLTKAAKDAREAKEDSQVCFGDFLEFSAVLAQFGLIGG